MEQVEETPRKWAAITPSKCVCVNAIGLYILKDNNNNNNDNDHYKICASPWLTPLRVYWRLKKVLLLLAWTRKAQLMRSLASVKVSKRVYKIWLCQNPWPRYVIYDDSSKINIHYATFCNQFFIEYKPTTIKNTQMHTLLERLHGFLGKHAPCSILHILTVKMTCHHWIQSKSSWMPFELITPPTILCNILLQGLLYYTNICCSIFGTWQTGIVYDARDRNQGRKCEVQIIRLYHLR